MSETVHGTAVLAGASGVLIRGASGAGKSSLAALMIERGARLVSDDRVHLSACHGRILAAAPASIAGRLELRGRGIVAVRHERTALIRLVVDIVGGAGIERMPEPDALACELLGVSLPRQPVAGSAAEALPLVRRALAALSPLPDPDLQSTRVWG
jgi:hypothetical protein